MREVWGWLLVALGALAACATHPHVMGPVESAPIRDPIAPALTLGPVADRAVTYNEKPHEGPPNPFSDEVFAALHARVPADGELLRDARLDAASAELAPIARTGVELDHDLVEFALHEHGIIEAAAEVFVVSGATPAQILAELEPKLGDLLAGDTLRVGIGGGFTRVVIFTHVPMITLGPTPRWLPSGGEVELDAMLAPGYHDPIITFSHDNGSFEHPHVTGLAFGLVLAPFSCATHDGPQWVHVEARDADEQLQRLVLFPITCGAEPARTFQIEPLENRTTSDVERRLVAIINRERIAAGRPPLAGDTRIAAMARGYAASMQQANRIAHGLGGTAPARMRAAGLLPRVSLETVLHADSLARASEILMNERAYRAIFERTDVTHLGLGIAVDRDHSLYIAIVAIYISPPVDMVRLTIDLEDRIRKAVPNLRRFDPLLSFIADAYARTLAIGWTSSSAWKQFVSNIGLHGARYVPLANTVTMIFSPDELQGLDLVTRFPGHPDIGIGIAQSARDGALAGRIWIVVFIGAPLKGYR